MKNLLDLLWSKVRLFFGIEYPDTVIPNGQYCYIPDIEKNKNKAENDYTYYIKPCIYYKRINKEYNGCKYLGMITNDDVFADQCKMCGKKLD